MALGLWLQVAARVRLTSPVRGEVAGEHAEAEPSFEEPRRSAGLSYRAEARVGFEPTTYGVPK